jgi:hypothetical protein
VRSDRNLYSKHLIEAQDEIAEMRRKFTIMNHQIQQLKEEIQAKDHGACLMCAVSRFSVLNTVGGFFFFLRS